MLTHFNYFFKSIVIMSGKAWIWSVLSRIQHFKRVKKRLLTS